MTTPLFRPEVMQAQQAQWLGSIRIARPPSFAWVTGIALVLAVLLVVFSIWGQVTRKARLPGLLVPVGGLIQVAAPQAGVLTQWLVREGDDVAAGQPLLRITSERHTAGGEAGALAQVAMQQRRSSLEAELRLVDQQTRQRHDALADRIRSLQGEQRQAQLDLETTTQRVHLARQTLQRFQELAASGFVSTVQAQQKQEELLDLQAREGSAQRSLQALQRDEQALRAEQAANIGTAQTSREQVARALASLKQEDAELMARQGVTVQSPQAGRVTALTQSAGQTVQAGQTLLSVVPAKPGQSENAIADGSPQPLLQAAPGELEAHLFAPSRLAGFIQPGQTVWLRYAAYPYQKFGMAEGVVARISETPLSPQDLPAGQAQALMGAAQSNEPLRRVSVRLSAQQVAAYGQNFELKAGAALEADVTQEARAIWEWIFEPLLAARQQLKVLSANPNKTSPGG